MILQALADAFATDALTPLREQVDALDFLTSPWRLSAWAGFVGLDVDAVRVRVRHRALTGS